MTDSLPAEVVAADRAHRRPSRDDLPLDLLVEDAARRRRAADREHEAFLRQQAAIDMLRSWANAHAKRDEVIRAAHAAGVSERQIHRITGVARTTIARVLAESSDSD